MAKRLSLISCDNFKLDGVTVTERELGHGSYATVLELEYLGLKCAGKKIHRVLLNQGNMSYTVRRFEQECCLLSQVRHPNIVQFLGFFYQEGEELPILVMECLPTNLASRIELHGVMPQNTCYSILHDVALGLCYLHSQTPPIIHRDLSSNNVLLTANMTAKIADLGVARILDISPVQVSHMTQTPGTAAFMPPEVMTANPHYNTSIDEFSYGILMIHVLSGRWPHPQVGPTRTNDEGILVPVTEAERREAYLQEIGDDHPLMDVILKCLHNSPGERPRSSEMVQRMSDMVSQFPTSHANQLEMEKSLESFKEERDRLKLVCCTKTEQLRVQAEELDNARTITATLNRAMEQKDRTIEKLSGQLTMVTDRMAPHKQPLTTSLTWTHCQDLPTERSIEQCTVINGKVYLSGQGTTKQDDQYIVCRYDPEQDSWDLLPPLPIQYYGLGQLNSKPIAVGGKKIGSRERTNELYTFEESLGQWIQTIPNMPTGRGAPAVISLSAGLVVAGGYAGHGYINSVEIFKLETSQWYVTDPLPIACSNMAAYSISNDTCYLLGGYRPAQCINSVFRASFDHLLRNARAYTVGQSSPCEYDASDRESAWESLPDTSTYQPAVVDILKGSLVVMGGWKTSQGREPRREIHIYSPSTNSWVHVGDLPAARAVTTAAPLSSSEFLMIGGWDGEKRVKTVYKGALAITT